MHTIEKRPSGYVLTFQGVVTPSEMHEWATQSKAILSLNIGNFGVIVDFRRLVRLQPEADTILSSVRALYRTKGMQRTAIVLANTILTTRFRRLAEQAGTHEWERYINVTTMDNWSEAAVRWVRDGTEPPFDFH